MQVRREIKKSTVKKMTRISPFSEMFVKFLFLEVQEENVLNVTITS